MIDRRTVLPLLGAIVTCPSAMAHAQDASKMFRIGVIGLTPAADLAGPEPRSPTQIAFLNGLRDLGLVYGRHFTTETRGSEGKLERMPELAAELVAARVDVIVATGAAVPALKQATAVIPIVMTATNDPVAQGFVQSLARPGGNITGLSLQSVETTAKRLELIKELVPGVAPMAFLWNAPNDLHWQAAQAAATQRGWQLFSLKIQSPAEIADAVKAAMAGRAGTLVISASAVTYPHRRRLAELAAANNLPAVYDLRPYVEAGGLMSYGPDINDIWRRAATYVHKIMRGAKPADIPVEQPTKFELVINGKAAAALGLTIPPSLLAFATEVIE